MNKAELVSAIAERTDFSKKDCERMLTACIDIVTETLRKGERVQLLGFGTFEVRTRAAHTALKPGTQEQIEVPESRVPAFKAGKGLRDAMGE